MFHADIQEDKHGALVAVARLMAAAGVEYVITGGLAAQLHVSQPRFTLDVDIVLRPEDEVAVREAITRSPFREQFELVHVRRRWTALVHRDTGTPIDINSSRLFTRLLEDPQPIDLEDDIIPFAAPLWVAYSKLRTQQGRWPRAVDKRLIDRADLIRLLRDNPGLYEDLRARVDGDMLDMLDAVRAESKQSDELPPYPDDDEADPPVK